METKYIGFIILITVCVIAYPVAKILIGIANKIDKKIEEYFFKDEN